MSGKSYIAIDLKSFYASVECVDRGLDPLNTNLVVADLSRTEKTICLAVSPSLKAYGIPGRPRLFEVVQKVKGVNASRAAKAPSKKLVGSSCIDSELKANNALAVDYIVAKPRMSKYMEASADIYNIYLKYIAPEDIHVYSIDEVFIDATSYLKTYNLTARELAMKMILDVYRTTGITATAGVGTNLYLCKVAMDIVAKHMAADENGVRIAELDEMSYRRLLWNHRPLTDFWRVGRGYSRKLEEYGMYTMGDVAKCSVGKPTDYYNEELLYKLFGVSAELLIDHAWGWEPCGISDIKSYRPETNSLCSGQVLKEPCTCEKARLALREMADLMSLDLVGKGLVTDQLTLTIGYDVENIKNPSRRKLYSGEITIDRYGREIPKHSHGTENIGCYTSSTRVIVEKMTALFDRIVNKKLLIRRLNICANRVVRESAVKSCDVCEQLDMFTDYEKLERENKENERLMAREKSMQKAVVYIKRKYGKNAILKGMNLEDGATAKDRNSQIGGHNA